jgi:hypothetical protein
MTVILKLAEAICKTTKDETWLTYRTDASFQFRAGPYYTGESRPWVFVRFFETPPTDTNRNMHRLGWE